MTPIVVQKRKLDSLQIEKTENNVFAYACESVYNLLINVNKKRGK